MRLLVTRPAIDADDLAITLTARGHTVFRDPLLDIRPRLDVALSLEGLTGLVFTSANGVRAFCAASQRRDFPVFAVGDRTAHAAESDGFSDVISANGDIDSLAATITAIRKPAHGKLLHITGSVTAGDLAGTLRDAQYDVDVIALYEAIPATILRPETHALLSQAQLDGVLLFSPRTARQWTILLRDAGLSAAAERLDHWCLSEAVAAALASGDDRPIRVAAQPTQTALLDAIEKEAT